MSRRIDTRAECGRQQEVGFMEDELLDAAYAYAARQHLMLAERLGSGIDGSVRTLKSEANPHDTAVKIHRGTATFWREVRCYERLREKRIFNVQGFVVPALVRSDAGLLAVEMTIVSPPFLVDLPAPIWTRHRTFPEEVWEEWLADKAEQFGERWETVDAVLAALKILGIYLLDPSPSNLQFD